MRRLTLALFVFLAAAAPVEAQSRIDVLAREFSKKKDTTKSKRGVTARKYKEVVSEPWRAPLRDYVGHYTSETIELNVRMAETGALIVSGQDSAAFEVRGAHVVDRVLSGRKVYRNGRNEAFEAAFLKRSDRDRPDESFEIFYGVGVLVNAPPSSGVVGPMRVFMTKR